MARRPKPRSPAGTRAERSRAARRAAARLTCGVAAALLALVPAPARALINPRYTVVDLVRDSRAVLVLRASAPQDGWIVAEAVETLLGAAPAETKFVFDYSDAVELTEDRAVAAFGGAETAPAVMCIQKEKQEGAVVAAVEIGTTWMGLTQGDQAGVWGLDSDANENALETVWGGSARRLVPAIRYALGDPAASFPVASTLTWSRDLSLGKLAGNAHGCLVTSDGVVVLSEGGDRILQAGVEGAPPTDVTDELGLASRSKAMASGDFNGDGRPDLASWDGKRLRLLLRGADGRFGTPTGGCDLGECLSLSAFGGGLVAGAGDGVVLLMPNPHGGFTGRRLAGPGGVCTVADFNDDGACDIVQVSAQAVALYAGQGKPGAFAAPAVTRLATVKRPVALVCGDYDTDGRLDVMVAGEGGSVLLSRDDARWTNIMDQTGELGAASGLGQGEAVVVSACPSDVNGDGRQCVAFFYAAASPGLFFSRGFACFGIARSLRLVETDLPAAEALGPGQTAGTLCDLNADLAPDLLAVDRQGGVWVVFSEDQAARRFHLTAENAGADPLTVNVWLGERRLGIWVVRPGEPASIDLPRAGKVTLRWRAAGGEHRTREVVVTTPTRVKFQGGPDAPAGGASSRQGGRRRPGSTCPPGGHAKLAGEPIA